ncbi:DUF6506 family protein [Kribbella sp. NPDC023855]|uniref:DUF6506 family protein n=1 Tax=Kribbella sp. NPDC023855 TaxID=3154698 RepID=UPI0033DE401D
MRTSRSHVVQQLGFHLLVLGEEDPVRDRAVISVGGLTTTIVPVPDCALAAGVAKKLVADGAQAIELCGGLRPSVVTEVLAATEGKVPVGGVYYGVESVHGLAALFPVDQR